MNVQRFIKRNASTILSVVGAAGVVATAVMAVKETPKAMSLLDDAMVEKGDSLTKWEKVKVAGPAYAPAIITGAATIACIFGSNIVSKHQQAALAGAYMLLDSSYKDYKRKVDELYGEEAGAEVRAEIAKDKYAGDHELMENNKELFFEFFSGRYFESTKDEIMRAMYLTNRAMSVDFAVSVNSYYKWLGLDPIPEHEGLGWSIGKMDETYWHPWIEFEWEPVVIEDEDDSNSGLECTIVHMVMEPTPDYLD